MSRHKKGKPARPKKIQVTWFVIVRPDNSYPVIIYADRSQAEHVAEVNGYKVVPVTAYIPENCYVT
jgi:hypothetical protein